MNKRGAWCLILVLALGIVTEGPAVGVAGAAGTLPPLYRVNVPYFSGPFSAPPMSIFWFGKVTPDTNYVDVRMGYNATQLVVYLAVFDRRLWYDTSPSSSDLMNWDAASLYLKPGGATGSNLEGAYRFDSQATPDDTPRGSYQLAYRGSGTSWVSDTASFTTSTGYWVETWGGFNTGANSRGWGMHFYIPFASLGLSGPPSPGTVWGMALAVHDRDGNLPETLKPDVGWPANTVSASPANWGQLAYGLPTYTPPAGRVGGTVTIRNGLNGTVTDGIVGGGTNCGYPLTDYWNVWGDKNYSGGIDVNVQNQFNLSDWPCFSKYYVTFPLSALPANKTVISATLKLLQFGNTGPGQGPVPSFLQVLSVGQDWAEASLTWNSGPMARENLGGIWVPPLAVKIDDVIVPTWRVWDVSRAVAEAYAAGEPVVRLAVYSADDALQSGRYFRSSDFSDVADRPTLNVVWGETIAAVHKTVWPVAISEHQQMTYTLSFLGSGTAMTLTDSLPAQVSAPGSIRVTGGGAAVYTPGNHQVSWTSSSVGVGVPITLTFPVTAVVPGPLAIRNTVVITDAAGNMSNDTALAIVDGWQVWLPLIRR